MEKEQYLTLQNKPPRGSYLACGIALKVNEPRVNTYEGKESKQQSVFWKFYSEDAGQDDDIRWLNHSASLPFLKGLKPGDRHYFMRRWKSDKKFNFMRDRKVIKWEDGDPLGDWVYTPIEVPPALLVPTESIGADTRSNNRNKTQKPEPSANGSKEKSREPESGFTEAQEMKPVFIDYDDTWMPGIFKEEDEIMRVQRALDLLLWMNRSSGDKDSPFLRILRTSSIPRQNWSLYRETFKSAVDVIRRYKAALPAFMLAPRRFKATEKRQTGEATKSAASN